MKTLIFRIIYMIPIFFLPLLMASCEKETEMEEIVLSRLFRPTDFNAIVNSEQVTLSWSAVKADSYFLELSKDSLSFTNELQTFTIEGTDSYIFEDLLDLTRYSARIKAISGNPATEDSGWQEITFMTLQ